MSADNWRICPRCRDNAKAEQEAKVRAAGEAYGKVSADEYQALLDAATAPADDLKETFREEYEFYGADEGTVTASYSGHCSSVCSLGVEFTYDRDFYAPKGNA